jgi:flagellar motor switch protein FliG
MQLRKKLNLSRFKRSTQGLIEFAILIEQADPSQRDRIISQADEQDPELLYKAMRKVVFFEELIYLEETMVAEILAKTSAKVLAYALQGTPPEFREKMLAQIGYREKKLFQDEAERLDTVPPTLVAGAQKQIIKSARLMEAQGKFAFELADCPRFRQKKKRKTAETEEQTPHLKLVK